MVLALAIGTVLLLALYVAFDTYIRHAQVGRALFDPDVLSRRTQRYKEHVRLRGKRNLS